MRREGFYVRVLAFIMGGLVALIGFLTGFVGFAVALLVVAAGAAVAWKALDASRKRSAGARLLNTVWIPVRDELADVVRGGGKVRTSESVWTHAPNLSKQNSGASFHREMERYVNQRRKVASMAASRLTTDEGIRQMESQQQVLLSISRELLPQARSIVEGMQGAAAGDTGAAVARPAGVNSITAPTPVRQRTREEVVASPPPKPDSPSVGPPRPRPAAARPAREAVHDAPSTPSARTQPPPPSDAQPARLRAQPPPPSERNSPASEKDAAPQPRTDESDLDSMAVCAALFDSKLMSYETNRLFDDRYKGKTIRWHGTLRRASAYSYDFTFGEGGGTKAEFDLNEVKQSRGTRMVRAYVQLPREDAARISARVGEMVTFEGQLLTCEGSSKRIYVGGGRIVD